LSQLYLQAQASSEEKKTRSSCTSASMMNNSKVRFGPPSFGCAFLPACGMTMDEGALGGWSQRASLETWTRKPSACSDYDPKRSVYGMCHSFYAPPRPVIHRKAWTPFHYLREAFCESATHYISLSR
jgi:hypothetical protein